MAFRDRIEVVVDFVTTGAKTNLGSLRQEMAQTDGALAKAKVGFKGLGDMAGAVAEAEAGAARGRCGSVGGCGAQSRWGGDAGGCELGKRGGRMIRR